MIKNKTSWLAFIPTLIFCFYLINSNSFAQNKAQNLKKLTTSSELIIVGNVKETESHWNENKTAIVTKVSIKPTEFIKGRDNGSDLFITVPGGEIDNIGELYTHMPRFAKDEEVLLFMKQVKNDYSIIGGESGKITLSSNHKGSQKTELTRQQIKELKNSIKNYLTE
ncbi:MAG: hypothetical protein OQJ81_11735 [Melioribacteraceae bacterium]|nr:hypothetical protein [Melioribacteraceae bacterium]